MRNISPAAILVCLVIGSVGTTAQAQLNQTWVSSSGNDADPCSFAQPCRTFSGAIAKTNAGGEIIARDSAEFGQTLTIDKSISIIVPTGVHGGLTPLSGESGININASGATVTLRGLYLRAMPPQGGSDGIDVTAVGTLHVENCVIANFLFNGIAFFAPGRLYVKDSIIRNNGLTSNGSGIVVSGLDASNKAYGSISNSRVEGIGSGLGLSAGVSVLRFADVSVSNTTAAGNFRGFAASNEAFNNVGAPMRLAIEDSVISNNTVGVHAGDHPNVIVRLSNSAVVHSTFIGIEAHGTAQITSRGDNTVMDNAGREKFTGTFAPQ